MGKANLDDDFRELFVVLNQAKVKYLLIGGYAVNFYGYHSATKDIDVWIATDVGNATRVSAALMQWGGFSKGRVPPSLFVEPDKVFVMGRPPTRIAILTGAPGVSFEECWGRRNVVEMDGVKVPVISLVDLLVNKKAAGRLKDLADIETLTKATSRKAARKRRS